MGINGGRGINSGVVLGGSGINIAGGGTPPFSFGNALQFDGVDDFVSITGINSSTNDYTISFWFQINSAPSASSHCFLGKSNSATVYIGIGGSNSIFFRASGDTKTFAFTQTISQNTWYHLMLSYDQLTTTSYAYLNGVASTTSPIVSSNFLNIDQLGRYASSASFSNALTLDEVGISYSKVGNLTDAQNLYNSGNGNFFTDYFTPIAYWRMNGTSGDATAIDEQGTYNGTLNNFNTSTCWVKHNEGIGYWVIGTTFTVT